MHMVWNAIIPILLHSKLLKGSQDEGIPLHCTYTNNLLTVKVIHQSERRSEVISVHTTHGKRTLNRQRQSWKSYQYHYLL